MNSATDDRRLDLYFDFSSSYTYLGLARIEALAQRHGLELRWRPIALGAIFKERGHAPPSFDTAKGRYTVRDIERCAAEQGLPFHWPEPFPFNSIPAARGFLWIESASPAQAVAFAHRVYAHAFAEGGDVASLGTLAALARGCGVDAEAFAEGCQAASIKALLIERTKEATALGVFGAPTVIHAGEMFWGADRIDQMDRWLAAR